MWLYPERQDIKTEKMLDGKTEQELNARPVTAAVNSTRNNSPGLIGKE